MIHYDAETYSATQKIEMEFETVKPQAPVPPNKPIIYQYDYSDLIGLSIKSKLNGKGTIVSTNFISNEQPKVVVGVQFPQRKTHYLLHKITSSPDLFLDNKAKKYICAAQDAFAYDEACLLNFYSELSKYYNDYDEYLEKISEWEKRKKRQIIYTVQQIQIKKERQQKEELKEKRKKEELKAKQQIEELKAKQALVPEFDYSKHILYVYIGWNTKCRKYKHDIISVTCAVLTVDRIIVRINAEYCLNCKIFLISDRSYMQYAMDYDLDTSFFKAAISINQEEAAYNANSSSHLKDLGYNVSATSGFSEEYRHKKLEQIIKLGFMQKYRVIRYLEQFMNYNGSKSENYDAYKKWENDLEFVRNLDIDFQPYAVIHQVKNYTDK